MEKPKSFDTWPIEKQDEWRSKKSEANREWRKNNPEKSKENNRKYRENNPEKVKCNNRIHNKKKKEERTSLKFFQMTQALSEIANINTEKK
jgi:hypothetical protein